jgi:hypothetical protein
MMQKIAIACALAGLAGLAACEKAGESVDTALEKVTTGEAKPGDGAFEKAGETIDHTLGTERKDAADSIADAVDGDAKTKPN